MDKTKRVEEIMDILAKVISDYIKEDKKNKKAKSI
jgi:hypothetical protein